jgi:hypothetical protein
MFELSMKLIVARFVLNLEEGRTCFSGNCSDLKAVNFGDLLLRVNDLLRVCFGREGERLKRDLFFSWGN